MSITDDPIKIRLDQAKEELDANVARNLTSATIAGILSNPRNWRCYPELGRW